MNISRLIPLLGLVVVALLSRFLPHPPNFTAMNAVALFGAYALVGKRFALVALFAILFLSDCVMGFHSQMIFVYASLGLTTLLAYSKTLPLCLSVPASSLLFFAVVNFGVWLWDGIYPMTLSGLQLCYIAALPFLANQLMGDLFYAVVLFGAYTSYKKFVFSGTHELA